MIKRNCTIAVTGANGLAGSAVVEHLRAEGFTCVIPITRDDCDLRNWGNTNSLFLRIKPYHVFHAAATVYGLGGNMAFQAKSILENTQINTNVIDAAHKCGSLRKITVMGTNAAYPWPTEVPFKEENIYNGRPDASEFGYGHAKRHMLAMLEAYQMSYGLEYCYIVSGNLYGPRDRFNDKTGHVLPSLIKKFSDAKTSGGTVEIWGDGSATRDFLYSKDLARVATMLMSEDLKPGAINIGSGETVSIAQLVAKLCVISGVPADRVRWDKSKPSGRLDCHSDLSRIGALGFTPNYSIDDGLRETWGWFEDSRRIAIQSSSGT
jgi:GDP-L-fucose synthase